MLRPMVLPARGARMVRTKSRWERLAADRGNPREPHLANVSTTDFT